MTQVLYQQMFMKKQKAIYHKHDKLKSIGIVL